MHMCSSSAARRLFTTHSHCTVNFPCIDSQTSHTSCTPRMYMLLLSFWCNEQAPLVGCLTPLYSSIWDQPGPTSCTTPRALVCLPLPASYRTVRHVCHHIALPLEREKHYISSSHYYQIRSCYISSSHTRLIRC